MTAILPQIPFRIHTTSWGDEGVIVAQFTAREEISRPYVIDALVLVTTPLALEDLPELGTVASLTLAPSDMEDNGPRRFHGVLSRVVHDAVAHDRGGTWLRLRIVPRLSLLKHRRTRRIFQDRTVLQIVDAVLGAHAVPWRWAVDTQPPVIGYCVQHDESDFAFVHRLLARFGLYYYFEQGDAEPGHQDAHETMVVSDVARHYPALGGREAAEPRVLKLVDRVGTYRPVESILTFSYERRGRPTSARLRDWEFTNPNAFSDAAETVNTEPSLGTDTLQTDEFDYRSANDAIRVRRRDARTVLEQTRADAIRGVGSSDCAALAPGFRFTVNNHDVARLNAPWVVTRVEHEGRVPEFARERRTTAGPTGALPPVYLNRFECAPAEVTVRPPRPARRTTPTSETAVVVGPAGEEIFVDEYGRIKVQFLWDRGGAYNERSSCWLRVSQPWAGDGWGFQFIPRIGMEVVVTFVNGDPDHPLVTGCLFNALRMPSHALPDQKSRSGIRTRSTPGGAGANELMFEDAAEQEQVYLHAQRNLDEVVRRDHTLRVGAHETIHVGANRDDHVGGERLESVGSHASESIGGHHTERIGADDVRIVGANQTLTVGGSQGHVVAGSAAITVGQDRISQVDGHDRVSAARTTTRVTEESITLVKGSKVTHVDNAYALHVEGAASLFAGQKLRIVSDAEIVLECGTSMVRILPDRVEIKGDLLVMRGEDAVVKLGEGSVKVLAKSEFVAKADTVGFKSSGAVVKLTGDVAIDGGKVALKSAASISIDDKVKSEKPTTIQLADADGRPLAGHPFLVIQGDGSEVAGVTDAQGQAVMDMDADAEVVFPRGPTTEAG